MVEDIAVSNLNVEAEVNLVENGKVRGVCDGGCTTTVCGKEIWKTFLEQRQNIGDYAAVIFFRCNRTFRLTWEWRGVEGDGEGPSSSLDLGKEKAYRGPSRTWWNAFSHQSSLHVRVEDHEVDYSTKTMCFVDDDATGWVEVERSNKGHYLFDILGENGREEEDVKKKEMRKESSSED